MTRDRIRAVLERALTWPEEPQEDAARVLMQMEPEGTTPYVLDAEDLADLDAAEEEIRRGDRRVPHEEVKVWLGTPDAHEADVATGSRRTARAHHRVCRETTPRQPTP